MKSPLLQLSLATVLCAAIHVNAQHNHAYDQAAAAHGLDSADYPGYAYFMEHGHHPTTEINAPMRYQSSQGAPLFMGNGGFESGDFTNWTGIIGDNFNSSVG